MIELVWTDKNCKTTNECFVHLIEVFEWLLVATGIDMDFNGFMILKDDKDLQIELLQQQIDELKGMIKNDANVTDVDAKQNATNTTRNDETNGTEIKSTKSSSIPKISRSTKE